jgi:hypothetical protein
MFGFILNLFKSSASSSNLTSMTAHLSNVVTLLEQEYIADGNAKNAVIDSFCALLQAHKTAVTTAPTTTATTTSTPVVESVSPTPSAATTSILPKIFSPR